MAVVALKRCASYEHLEVREAVYGALVLALGDEAVRTGGRVLLKPNLAAARRPERCVTTHPEIVGAAIDFFRGHGCRVFVGDSPAGAVRGVARVWDRTGIAEVCRARGAELVNFEAGGWVEKSVEGRPYRIARSVLEFDRIVSLPKFKAHVLTLVTGAVKNMFGCVPGFAKSTLHLTNPKPPAMSRVIVDVFAAVPPWVTLMDAVDVMEGNGPSSGQVRHLGLVAASRDAVAVDAVVSGIVGIDPLKVPTTREAWHRGLGVVRPEEIELAGEPFIAAAVPDFQVPSNWHFFLVPDALSKAALRWFWVKPIVHAEKCTGCGDCEGACAALAVRLIGGKAQVEPGRCVSCLCCIEACPSGAIEPRMSRLARLLA
jgi:uncharacterized protein (DUF362 family)/Pyruvate/2-oxoacid:ferredoxin oxidoreductase delta subunit